MRGTKAPLAADIRIALVEATTDRLCQTIRRLPNKASQKRVLMHLHSLRPEWDVPIEAVMLAAGLAEA